MHAGATRGIFFLITTKRFAEEFFLSWSKSYLKNKQTFEISIALKKYYFFKCELAPDEEFFLDTTKRCIEESFSSLSESCFKNKFLKYKKTNVSTLDSDQKMKNYFFFSRKCMLPL